MNAGTVDIWIADLDLPAVQLSWLWDILSADEKARARAFVAVKGRNQFIAGRAFLRKLLGQLLAREPESLCFRYGAFGKPVLDLDGAEIDFNLSHAGTVAAVAVATRAGGIGVDVEWIRPLDDIDAVIRAAFTAHEAAQILSLPQPLRLPAFYRAWTRKEAVLKARGCGMSGERHGPDRDTVWVVRSFDVGDAYSGAVACPGTSWKIRPRAWDWPRPPVSGAVRYNGGTGHSRAEGPSKPPWALPISS
jgi:phosphopantetheinyl transferase